MPAPVNYNQVIYYYARAKQGDSQGKWVMLLHINCSLTCQLSWHFAQLRICIQVAIDRCPRWVIISFYLDCLNIYRPVCWSYRMTPGDAGLRQIALCPFPPSTLKSKLLWKMHLLKYHELSPSKTILPSSTYSFHLHNIYPSLLSQIYTLNVTRTIGGNWAHRWSTINSEFLPRYIYVRSSMHIFFRGNRSSALAISCQPWHVSQIHSLDVLADYPRIWTLIHLYKEEGNPPTWLSIAVLGYRGNQIRLFNAKVFSH